jgi:hypothetical protein
VRRAEPIYSTRANLQKWQKFTIQQTQRCRHRILDRGWTQLDHIPVVLEFEKLREGDLVGTDEMSTAILRIGMQQ